MEQYGAIVSVRKYLENNLFAYCNFFYAYLIITLSVFF